LAAVKETKGGMNLDILGIPILDGFGWTCLILFIGIPSTFVLDFILNNFKIRRNENEVEFIKSNVGVIGCDDVCSNLSYVESSLQ
jgi:hypothetical protein